MITAVADVTLPLLSPALGVEHVTRQGDVTSVLPLLQVAGDVFVSPPTIDADVDVTLPSLQASIAGQNPEELRIAVTLPRLKSFSITHGRGRIFPYTSPARASGDMIYCFVGPPDVSVQWSIESGSGVLTPFTSYTDEFGFAFCKYSANGYSGPLAIGVTHAA